MTVTLDQTHDPSLTSWVESANAETTDFPIQNLPYGAFRRQSSDSRATGQTVLGIAIGDSILDLQQCLTSQEGVLGDLCSQAFSGPARHALEACQGSVLNPLMALDSTYWKALRSAVSQLLSSESAERQQTGQAELEAAALASGLLVKADSVEMVLAVEVGDYTDFYCSLHHATNVGSLFRPDNPLLPNYKHLPVGYHGRSSSLVVSGTPVRRPNGQVVAVGEELPQYSASRLLDYELEVGFFVGGGNRLGESIDIDQAEQHIFGLSLVNDWSARDIQKWEYQPLGPFLGKSFATTLGPWIVTLDALAPFRSAELERDSDDPARLDYLESERNRRHGGFDVSLEVRIGSAVMRENDTEPSRVSRSNLRDLYWTAAQMLTHHASNGCNMRAGDLFASGTVSGADESARGCLLELTWRGTKPIELAGGETRKFLQDGDEVAMSGWCQREGTRRVGFGECRGVVVPAAGTNR